MAYKNKYLRVRNRQTETTVCRVDVSHLNKKGREAEWDRLDAKYPNDEYLSCFEQTNDELPCYEIGVVKVVNTWFRPSQPNYVHDDIPVDAVYNREEGIITWKNGIQDITLAVMLVGEHQEILAKSIAEGKAQIRMGSLFF